MNIELIKQEAESFFEWTSDKRSHTTYMSCLIFAKHCVDRVLPPNDGD